MKNFFYLLLVGSALLIGLVLGMRFFLFPLGSEPVPAPAQEAVQTSSAESSSGEPAQAKLLVGGDIVFHPITYSPQYENVLPPYDFAPMFARMSEDLKAADYATITFEAACNPDRPYSGYPLFNTPPEAIARLHEAGFDAFATATNHILDAGWEGLEKTFDEMDRVGVGRFGAHKEGEKSWHLADVSGVQVAFLNYGEMYNGLEKGLSADEMACLSPLNLDQVKEDIDAAREAGAEIVAVYPHWGVEYQVLPEPWQVDMAREMAQAGADLVIGSHPHVIQPYEWVETERGKSFVVYSLGNAMSNQRAAFLGTIDTEIGAFLDITLVKDKDGARVEEVHVIPSAVYVRKDGSGLVYETDFLHRFLEDTTIPAADKPHLQTLLNRAEEILATPIPEPKKA